MLEDDDIEEELSLEETLLFGEDENPNSAQEAKEKTEMVNMNLSDVFFMDLSLSKYLGNRLKIYYINKLKKTVRI